ncbi:Cyclin [Quillaja saponaria]|uniref:B-like cyclin n=1 Tax=Quillaja saponaria TaxID=32244 RepID=A0AAD7PFV3_QUISA|nr:Cyclin [Quillaja saponaria]
MADSSDRVTSNLLCSESSNMCFDDLECNTADGFGISPSNQINHDHYESPSFSCNESEPIVGFPLSADVVRLMVEREREHLPREDYLKRLRSGDLDLSVRREALDWIWKAHANYSFGPLSFCLSMNYLDRFLSVYELPKGKTWTGQLLAVACLSLAAKMEETKVPQSVDLQVGEPKFVFEAKTIQRMELLVLNTLNWRLHALTPCSFIDYCLSRMGIEQHSSKPSISGCIHLILSTIRGIDFLEFKPSEIAAAVAISVSGKLQTAEIDKAMSCFIYVEKEKVLKCVELIKDLSLISGSANVASTSAPFVPQSPVGVLDAACLSYKSDELTVGSCVNSSHNSPDTKRSNPDIPSELEFKS